MILSHFILLHSCINFIISSYLVPFIHFSLTNIHKYNTRLAAKQSYYLPFVRTNYGKFNIWFQSPSIWNCIDKDIKLSSKAMFKKKIQAQCYFYFLFLCDVYVCVCVSDLNYPKQIVILAACPF